MLKSALVMVAVGLGASTALVSPAQANVAECLAKIQNNERDLAPLTKETRDRLVRDPSQIADVIKAAASARPIPRSQIELGVVLAIEYLKCVDQTGYQAIMAYLNANASNPVVAEILAALSGHPSFGGGGGGGGFGGGGGQPASAH